MYFNTFLSASFATYLLFWTTKASSVKASVYQSSDCSGSSEVVYVDTAIDYCFGVGGRSINNFIIDSNKVDTATLTTWSGSNCEGSSAEYVYQSSLNQACITVPFAGVQLTVNYFNTLR
jgi:hypothetical protein